MIHRHFIVGIHALGGEVAVAGITHQQALAFQVTANPLGDGTGQLGEFTIGWRFNPAKPCGLVITANVHAVQKEHVEVDIEIKRPPKSLNQGDGPGMCGGFGIAGLVGQVRGNGAVDDAQHLAHDFGLTGKQKAQRERYAQHPLPHRLMGQDFVHQQSSAVCHLPRPATGAKTAAFTTERQEFLMVTCLTTDPQEAMFKPSAFQVLIKFPADESGQVFAVAGQFGLELGPVFLDDLVE
jgi:hypothetical protein